MWAARGLETGRQNPEFWGRGKAKGQKSVESVPNLQNSVFPPLVSLPPRAAPLPVRSVPGGGVESKICFGFLKDIWEQNDMFLSLGFDFFFPFLFTKGEGGRGDTRLIQKPAQRRLFS